jgi:hypothetical protein
MFLRRPFAISEMADVAPFSVDELADAYAALSRRCLSQSTAWVLDFLIAAGSSSEIAVPPSDPQFLLAQSQFRIREFKRAANTLRERTDQDSVGVTLLAKLLDTQRGIEQTVSDSTSFLGILPVSPSCHFDVFQPLIADTQAVAESLDPLNRYLFAAILSKGGRYQDALPHLLKSLNEFPLNRSA